MGDNVFNRRDIEGRCGKVLHFEVIFRNKIVLPISVIDEKFFMIGPWMPKKKYGCHIVVAERINAQGSSRGNMPAIAP